MTKYAQLPDGKHVGFPDNWTEEQMDEAVYRDFSDQFPDRNPGILDTVADKASATSADIMGSLGQIVNPPAAADVAEPDNLLSATGKHIQNLPAVGKMTAGGLAQSVAEPLPITKGAIADKGLGISDIVKGLLSGEFNQLLLEPFTGKALTPAREAIGEAGRTVSKSGVEDYQANQPEGLTGVSKVGSDIIRAVTEMVPAYSAAFLTKNPAMIPGVMGTQIKGRSMSESIEEGLPAYQAAAKSNFDVFAEGLPEYIPGLAILSKAGPAAKIGWGALGEGAQEMVTEVLQQTYDKTELENMSLKDAIKNVDWGHVLYSGLIGTGAGAGLGAAVAGAEKATGTTAEAKAEKAYNEKIDTALAAIADKQARDSMHPDKTEVSPEATVQKPADVGPAASAATAAATELEQAQQSYDVAKADETAVALDEQERLAELKRIKDEADRAYTEQEEVLYAERKAGEVEAELQKAQQDTRKQNRETEAQRVAEAANKKAEEAPTAMAQAYQDALDEALIAELKADLPAAPVVAEPKSKKVRIDELVKKTGSKKFAESTASLETALDKLDETNKRLTEKRAKEALAAEEQGVEEENRRKMDERRAVVREKDLKRERRHERGEKRRKQWTYRKEVENMTGTEKDAVISQLRQDATVNDLTKLNNRVAWEGAEKKKAIGAIDADSLKYVNDSLGNKAGDDLLVALGNEIKSEFGDDAFHTSGDEYWVMGDTADSVKARLDAVLGRVKVQSVEGPGGSITGLGFSYGIAENEADADRAMKANKAARTEEGSRVERGEQPPGVVLREEGASGGTLYSNPVPQMMQTWEKLADKAIDKWNDVIGWRYSTLGNLPAKDVYLVERYKTLGRIADVDRIAKDVYSTFKDATEPDQRAVYDYLTTPNATPTIIGGAAVRRKAVETKEMINATGKALVDRGLLSEEAFERNQGGYLPRTYLKYILGNKLIRQITGGKKVSRMTWSRARKDIPAEVRELILGEITDPAYLASKGLGVEMRDVAIIDFLNWIATHQDWIHTGTVAEWEDRTVSAVWLDKEASRIERQAAYYKEEPRQRALEIATRMREAIGEATPPGQAPPDSKDYREVPVNRRYGRLQGVWVRKEIYADLIATGQIMPTDADFWESWFGYGGKGTKVTQLWKMSKVAMNPPAQIRNAFSNMILLHFSGMPMAQVPIYVTKAAKDIAAGGRYWTIAQKLGVTESTFAAQELYRIERDLIDLESRMKGKLSLATVKNMAAIVGEFSGDAYQFIEALGKTARIMYGMDKEGLTADEAGLKAQKWLFDYSLVPSPIRTMRNMPLGVPFVTFYYKVLPRLLETAIKRPWAYTPYIALPSIMATLFAEVNDVDDDDVKQLQKAIPGWLQERGNSFLWPVKDQAGRWQAVDFGYILPWSMFQEATTNAAVGDFAESVKSSGVFGGPIPNIVTAIKTNRDPFTGRTIVDPGATPDAQAMGILTYMYDLSMPTWLTNTGFAGKLYAAINEDLEVNAEMGRTVLTPGQATLRLFGANVYPFNPERSRGKNIEKQQKEIQEIRSFHRKQIKDIINDKKGNQEQRINEITEQMSERIQEAAGSIEQYADDSEVPESLRTQ